MKLKIIGTGSQGNAYLLHNDKESLLIECGVNIKAIKSALKFNLVRLVGCIVTHEHGDHAKAIFPLMASGINVFATEKTHEALGSTMNHRAAICVKDKTFTLGGFKIKPFMVKHDAADPVGYLIHHKECGTTLFMTDTFYCPYVFPGLNNIIIETNYSSELIGDKMIAMEFLKNRIIKSHMSLETAIQMLKKNDLSAVNNIVLIHLSDSNSDEAMFKREVEDATGKTVTVSSNGLEINFNKTPF